MTWNACRCGSAMTCAIRARVWRINRDHPAVQWVQSGGTDALDAVAALLKLLEENLPIHDIHIYMANDQPIADTAIPDRASVGKDGATSLLDAFSDQPEVVKRFVESLPVIEPFNRNPEATRRIIESLHA